MWALENQTSFAAERTWLRDQNGAEVWIVAVKATYDIYEDGTLQLADQQQDLVYASTFHGDPATSSIVYETDFVLRKLTTDVLVCGHAYAPYGEQAQRVDVSLAIAGINKSLSVFGNRVWERSLSGLIASKAQPFIKMPIVYERAFGGGVQALDAKKVPLWAVRNPVGQGFGNAKEDLIDKPLPNIENPNALISRWNDRPKPVGFGAISRHWSPRIEFCGTYDEAWKKQRKPLLPKDFDMRFYQAAPLDQQSKVFLRGREQVELRNLSSSGTLRFYLPKVRPGLITYFSDRKQKHGMRLHTVMIEPDVPRVMLTWHSALPCHHDVYKLKQTIVINKAWNDRISTF